MDFLLSRLCLLILVSNLGRFAIGDGEYLARIGADWVRGDGGVSG